MNSGVLKLFLENESLEEQMYDDYYRQILATANERAATGTREPREPAAAQLTRDVMADRKAEFGPRHQAISAYAEALDTIAAGHQRLYENRNKIDTKETLAMIKTYTKKIQATMKAINAAGW
jgi:hypothetical protein